MTIAPRKADTAFTLPELMVTMGILGLVGLMVFLVLNSGMTLYAKNTAVNSAHQQARAGVDQMLANLHSSVSIPQLVDANATDTSIVLYCPGYAPGANSRLNIPSHSIEYDITSSAVVGVTRQFNL